MLPQQVDVLIVGGGPVGLVLAYQLSRFGCRDVCVVEKHPKSEQDEFGRAITLYPRSIEMLDQLDLTEDMLQQCFACRTSITYDKEGQRVEGRGWNFLEHIQDTFFDFALVLRQKYVEAVYRDACEREHVPVHAPAAVTDIQVDESLPAGAAGRVRARVLQDGVEHTIACKYLIGADGGRSFVRKALGIPFEGEQTEEKWVRIDGDIETDMPNARAYGALESPTHGNVLWAPLDRNATRIGFALPASVAQGGEAFSEEVAVRESILACKPFDVKFKRVHWYTIYSVAQRVARSFFVKDGVFLAGDACHTHSSGAAQGMNTGMHDAVNLAWKLALVLRGIGKPELLQTYEAERRPAVQQLINYDKDISALMSLQLPKSWQGAPDADPNLVLGLLFQEASGFNTGLGISYGLNALNVDADHACSVRPGTRAPDVTVSIPACGVATRLQKVTPNRGVFYIAVFAGAMADTRGAYADFRDALAASTSLQTKTIRCITIPVGSGPSVWELLGGEPIGRVYYDITGQAHERYTIDVAKGAVVVIRPDGWLATSAELAVASVAKLEAYFAGILA